MDEDSTTSVSVPIPEELIEFIKPELEPGEKLLWAASSKPRRMTGRPTGIRPLGLGIVCLGLGATCFIAILGPFRLRLLDYENVLTMGGILLGIGGFIAILLAWYAWHCDRVERYSVPKGTYAVSDRRAMIWSPVPGSAAVQVFTFAAGSLKKVHRLEFPDGTGDLLVGEISTELEDEDYDQPRIGFFGIDHVRSVEELVRKTLVQPRQSLKQ